MGFVASFGCWVSCRFVPNGSSASGWWCWVFVVDCVSLLGFVAGCMGGFVGFLWQRGSEKEINK